MKEVLQPENQADFRTTFITNFESYVKINGKKLRVCHNFQNGKFVNDGHPLHLFIHGLGGSLGQFEPLLRLTHLKGKKFLTLDLPGFGQSDELESYSMKSVIETIRSVVDLATGNQKSLGENTQLKLILTGHSMGCYLCLHFFETYSKNYDIRKIALLSPPKPIMTSLSKRNYWTQWALWGVFKLPFIFDLYRNYFDQTRGLSSSGMKRFFFNNDPNDYDLRYRKLWQFHSNVQNKSRSVVGYLLGWDAINWEKVNTLVDKNDKQGSDLHVLVFLGKNDQVTLPEDVKQFYESFENKNNTKLIEIPNCSHTLCFDAPLVVCELFSENVLTE